MIDSQASSTGRLPIGMRRALLWFPFAASVGLVVHAVIQGDIGNPIPASVGILMTGAVALVSMRRLNLFAIGEPIRQVSFGEWLLGMLLVGCGALVLAQASVVPGLFWPGVAILLALPWIRAVGLDRMVPTGNPFASARYSTIATHADDAGARATIGESEEPPRRIWVENVVGLVSALVFIVLSYTYFLEAFRIPTGSMEPTLYGDPVMGDRAMVDKQTYQFGDPKRGDVAVFRFPQNRAQPYVKRTAGLPNEALLIAKGDLWIADNRDKTITPWRKHADIGESGWLRMLTFEGGDAAYGQRFMGIKGRASAKDGVITLEAAEGQPAEFRFPREGSVTNHFPLDGSPKSRGLPYDTEAVGDVRISFDLESDEAAYFEITVHRSDCAPIRFTFGNESLMPPLATKDQVTSEKPVMRSGRGHFSIAVADGLVGDSAQLASGSLDPSTDRRLSQPFASLIETRTQAGNPPDLTNTATLLELANAVPKLESCHVTFQAIGGRVTLRNLTIDRDFHYIGRFPVREGTAPDGSRAWQRDREPSLPMAIKLGADEYLMLGDHTEDSSDSRAWILADITLKDGTTRHLPIDEIIRLAASNGGGIERWYTRTYAAVMQTPGAEPKSNVETLMLDAIRRGELGQNLRFTDTFGISRDASFADVESIRLNHAPGVPRQLIDGKLLGSLFPTPRFVK